MTLNLNLPELEPRLAPRITVIGVGGAGGNAVNNMIQANLEGVEFLATNSDAQALSQSICERQIQLGRNITQGLGAGSRPDVGRAAAEESLDEVMNELDCANMVFVTAGMGGGTGTGAAPVIARAAREAGMLTVGVVTKPFHFEGVHRMRMAEAGLSELQQYVDTLIIIPNQNLFRVSNEKTTFADAFKMADNVLYSGVRGVTDLMVMPGLINLDFADIRAVMTEMGKAMMGTGEASGENRAVDAAEAAISNPLLDDVSMKGARGILINITGSEDLTLFEVDAAANRIRDEVDPEANIIFGSTFDSSLEGSMRISVVATGIDVDEAVAPRPVTLSLVSDRDRQARAAQAGAGAGPDGGTMASAEEVDALEPEVVDYETEEHEYEQPVAAAQGEAVASSGMSAYEREPEVAESPRYQASSRMAESVRPGRSFFTPPPPMQSEEPAPTITETPAEAEPFAEAAIANASSDYEEREAEPVMPTRPRKGRGLFARVTSAARAVHASERAPEPSMDYRDSAQESAQEPRSAAAAHRDSASESRQAMSGDTGRGQGLMLGRQASDSISRRGDSEPEAQQDPQRSLSGLDLDDRPGASSSEEDLLDIPAFLRRQAN